MRGGLKFPINVVMVMVNGNVITPYVRSGLEDSLQRGIFYFVVTIGHNKSRFLVWYTKEESSEKHR